jgi:hypothetical protein
MELNEDLLRGGPQIAAWIGMSARDFHYLAQNHDVPVFMIGRQMFARKSELATYFSAQGRAPVNTPRGG